MPQTRKAFHFDLDTKKLTSNGAPKDAWGKIRGFLETQGFEHIQYSGYESRHAMSYSEMNIVLENLQDAFPWFASCAKDAKVTSITGRHHDALAYMKAYVSDRGSDAPLESEEFEDEPLSFDSETKAMRDASDQLNEQDVSHAIRNRNTER